MINNIHGIGHHKTIIPQDIIKDQQIGEVVTTTHGIKGSQIFQLPTIKD